MKKLLALVICLSLFCLLLVSCGETNTPEEPTGEVTTEENTTEEVTTEEVTTEETIDVNEGEFGEIMTGTADIEILPMDDYDLP